MKDVFELTTHSRPLCFLFRSRTDHKGYNETPTEEILCLIKWNAVLKTESPKVWLMLLSALFEFSLKET